MAGEVEAVAERYAANGADLTAASAGTGARRTTLIRPRPWAARRAPGAFALDSPAGRARLQDGSLLLWSIAEGRRGARWRASTRRDGRLLSDLLLEVGHDGRPGRLEIATPAGLLTLHPEADGRRPTATSSRPTASDPSRSSGAPATGSSRARARSSLRRCVARSGGGRGRGARLVPGLHVDDELRVWRGRARRPPADGDALARSRRPTGPAGSCRSTTRACRSSRRATPATGCRLRRRSGRSRSTRGG